MECGFRQEMCGRRQLETTRKMPGRFAEGPRSPGFILPASAVSEQENCGGCKNTKNKTKKTTTFLLCPPENCSGPLWAPPPRSVCRRVSVPCTPRGEAQHRGLAR